MHLQGVQSRARRSHASYVPVIVDADTCRCNGKTAKNKKNRGETIGDIDCKSRMNELWGKGFGANARYCFVDYEACSDSMASDYGYISFVACEMLQSELCDASPQRPSPQRSSPQYASPQRTTPQRGSPQRTSPQPMWTPPPFSGAWLPLAMVRG